MSRAVITEGLLTGIANAIREKLGVQDTYTPPQMAAAIASIPAGGITPTGTKNITQNGTHDVTEYSSANVNVQPNLQSKTVTQNGTVTADTGYDGLSSVVVNVPGGGGAPLLYRLGGFFGNANLFVNTLNVTLTGTPGEFAVLIVEHRTAINVTGGLSLVDTSGGTDYEQYISVYTKSLTSATETVTITTTDSSNKILAAATVYFNRQMTIGMPAQQHMDSESGNYKYTILPSQNMRLAVINNVYAGDASTHTIAKTRYALPSNFIGTETAKFRLVVFVVYDLNENVVVNIGTTTGPGDYATNRLFLYDIT